MHGYTLGADSLWVRYRLVATDTITRASDALEVTAAQLFAEV